MRAFGIEYAYLKVKDRSSIVNEILIFFRKLRTDHQLLKKFKKTNPNKKKMNIPLGVFRFKLSTDQKSMMLRKSKIAKSPF